MKKIILDETIKQNIVDKFINYINTTKFTENRINFSAEIMNTVNLANTLRPTVYISATAYLKMLLYVQETNVEIAWHGTVERNKEQNWYHIKDVFLYPQTISACTVNTDQEKYQEWLQNIEDDNIFNNIRFQGHSHVNMGTTPSGTDLNMYHNFLQVLPKDDYYIFMIMNKSKTITCFIYDLAKNLIYETQDIDIKIITNDSQDLIEDLKKEKNKYCENTTPKYDYNDPFKRTEQNSYAQSLYANTAYHNYAAQQHRQENAFDLDEMFEELDNKYKNPTILSKHFKHKGNKKK